MIMEVGKCFEDFQSFQNHLNEFQNTSKQLFVVQCSKSVEAANTRLDAAAIPYNANLKRANVTFQCKHGGDPRFEGTGIRNTKNHIGEIKKNIGQKFVCFHVT